MNLSHKIRMYPSKEQEVLLIKSCGISRFTYNWGLSEWKKQYEGGNKPNINLLKKQFNSIKREQFPWIYDCPKDANQQAFVNLKNAFQRFFKKSSKYPQFKKKGIHDSFYVSNDKFSINDNFIKLPKIGKMKISENLRFKGKINNGVVSRISNKWFISISVDVGDYKKERIKNNTVGIDLGIKNFMTCSDGVILDSISSLKCSLKKLKRLSEQHSRKIKGSNNRKKSQIKLSNLHYKISCKRNDFLHKITTQLCRENQSIIIEDLNVKGLIKNRKLSRSIQDSSFGEFKRQLEYKSKIYGNNLVKVNRFFPSSKLCSKCGCKKDDLKLSDRIYKCNHCDNIIDRDLNASINILNEGLRILMANEELTLVDKEALVS